MSIKNALRDFRSAFSICAAIKPWCDREAFTAMHLNLIRRFYTRCQDGKKARCVGVCDGSCACSPTYLYTFRRYHYSTEILLFFLIFYYFFSFFLDF